MTTTYHNQKGSAHIVIIIILVVVLLGSLGFVLWQNFTPKKAQEIDSTTVVDEKQDPVPKNENKVFDDAELAFEYPNTGWIQAESQTTDEIVRLVTDNYTPSVGMGLDAGASLVVYRTNQQEVPVFPGVKDVEEIRIDDNKAYKYVIEYEGYRLQAFFTVFAPNGEKNYAVTMETTSHATDDEIGTFELVLATLDIK